MPSLAEAPVRPPQSPSLPVRHETIGPSRTQIREHKPQVRPSQERQVRHPMVEAPAKKEYPKGPNTAVHEVLHWLIAERRGYSTREVSVQQEGNSLGRVILDGNVHPMDFQVFAAASSIPIEGYKPDGFGHDHWQIHQIEAMGGHSLSEAQMEAARIIHQYDPEVIHLTAIKLQGEGTVKGSIRGLLQEAYIEVAMKRGLHDKAENMMRIYADEKLSEEPEKPVNEITIFDTLTEDRLKVTVIVGGLRTSEEITCGKCGTKGGGHAEFCRHFKKEEPKPLVSSEQGIEQKQIETERPVASEPHVTGRRIQRSETRHPIKKRDEESSEWNKLYERRRTTPMRPRGMR